ncbi:MAG: prepilin peptidase [bacterium]
MIIGHIGLIGLIFIFGLAFGSFVNVVVDRLPQNRKITGRSRCEFCKKTLRAQDLIPLLSFLFLKGRCRYCKKKLSVQYPLVEFLTGALFAGVYQVSGGFGATLPYYLALSLILWIIFLIDLKKGIIPTKLVIAGVVLVLANYTINNGYYSYKLYNYLSSSELGGYVLQTDFLKNRLLLLWRPLLSGLMAGLALAGFFYGLIVVTRGRGMGGGDVRLGFLLGLMLGPVSTVVAVFLAFLTGAVTALILLLMKKKNFGQTVPFGPFLASAGLFSLFFGHSIWNWYLTTL